MQHGSARKRLTRREIKQDKLLVWTSRISMLLEENFPIVVTAVVAAVFAVVAVYVYRGWSEDQSVRGMVRLVELEALVRDGNTDEAVSFADELIDEFSGRPDRLARLYKADALRANGDFAQAKELYEAWSGEGDDEVHDFHATRGLADCLSAERNYTEAGEELLEWAEGNPESPLAAYALVDAAVNFELATDYVRARDTLQTAIDLYSDAQVVSQARRRLKLIKGAASVQGG